MTDIDQEAVELFGGSNINTSDLVSISEPVKRAIELMATLEQAEEFLKTTKAELNLLLTKQIPDAMATVGVLEFSTDDGMKVSIKDFLSGSLPKDPEQRSDAFSWLEKNDLSSIIKKQIDIRFERGDNRVSQVEDVLEDFNIPYELSEGVHPQTLYAAIRERMKNGEEVPLDKLGLFAGRVAKIAPNKSKKSSPTKNLKRA